MCHLLWNWNWVSCKFEEQIAVVYGVRTGICLTTGDDQWLSSGFFVKRKGNIRELDAAALTAMAIPYGIKLVSAIVTLAVRLMIANMLVSLTNTIMTKGQVDPALQAL